MRRRNSMEPNKMNPHARVLIQSLATVALAFVAVLILWSVAL